MNIDIRVDVSWLTHKKRWRLYDVLGNDGVMAIMDLWLYASIHAPNDGILRGLTPGDIVRACGYRGQGDLIKELTSAEICLLDAPKGAKKDFRLHNWKNRQPYLATSKERSAIASLGGKAKKNKCKSSAASTEKLCSQHSKSVLPAQESCAPSPILSLPTNQIQSAIYDCLIGKVKTYRPNHKLGKREKDEGVIRLMVERDKRDAKRTLDLLEWYPIGQKYIPEIFSATALREKWDKLDAAYSRAKGTSNQPPTPTDEEVAKNRKLVEEFEKEQACVSEKNS